MKDKLKTRDRGHAESKWGLGDKNSRPSWKCYPFPFTTCFYPDIRISCNTSHTMHLIGGSTEWPHVPKQKCSLTSQIPSMQTSFLFGEQGVPSFTLLDMAKKNSKFSALQYSLHRSSSRSKETKGGHGQEEILGQWRDYRKDELNLFRKLLWSRWEMLQFSTWLCVHMRAWGQMCVAFKNMNSF